MTKLFIDESNDRKFIANAKSNIEFLLSLIKEPK